jgi:threonine synthase
MFTCPHTGVALAVLTKLIKSGVIKSNDKIVVISTAHGLKFTDFKVGYHESTLAEVTSQYANPAVHLPANTAAVKAEIKKRLGY